MPSLTVLKSTSFLWFLLVASCMGQPKPEPETTTIQKVEGIISGAQRPNLYLSLLRNKSVGVVANQTSVIYKNNEGTPTSQVHLVDTLLRLGVNLKKVFAPEHGFRGTADAGELVKDGRDTETGLPLISLYGKNKKPSAAQLEGLEVVLFDIQDVGVRFYTYIATLQLVMEACAAKNIPVIVLDRPNPNAHYVDGPTMETKHQSFLGMTPIPLVYGMTIGEYALMLNGKKWLENGLKADLTVIPLKNYTHDSSVHLPIRPSPNLPNDQSIMLYPSLGLFEGTNVNAGRGTEFQFQRFGASFLDQNYFDFEYQPEPNFGSKYPKEKDKLCHGRDLAIAEVDGVTLQWLIEAYQNCLNKNQFFKTASFTAHSGTDKLQKQLEAGLSEKAIKQSWQKDIAAFKKIRKKYLIYP